MLDSNQLITIILSPEIESLDGDLLGNSYSSYFTTFMFPMYATSNDVRLRIGNHITNIYDDTINQLIHYYSLMAEKITTCPDITDPDWIYFANQWVTLTVSLVILDNGEAFVGSQSGGITKALGDFTIVKKETSGSGAGIKDLMSRLQCELYKLEPAVRYCREPLTDCLGLKDHNAAPYNPQAPMIVTRGVSDFDYPMAGRRWVPHGCYPMADEKIKLWSRWFKTRYSGL